MKFTISGRKNKRQKEFSKEELIVFLKENSYSVAFPKTIENILNFWYLNDERCLCIGIVNIEGEQ
jgi:hypothetical protein